jgi:hypothetical protein
MAQLDINPDGEKQGIIQSHPQVPKLNKPIETKAITNSAVAILVLFVFISLALLGTNLIQKSRINSYNSKINDQKNQLANLSDTQKKAEALYGQVQNLQSLWSSRIYFSNAMKDISSNVISGNKIDQMSVDNTGKLHIKGTSNSMQSLAKLMSSFENNSKYSGVSLNSTNISGSTVAFDIQLNFSPSLLHSTTKS